MALQGLDTIPQGIFNGDKPIAIHPIVVRSVDPEVLEKMRVKGE